MTTPAVPATVEPSLRPLEAGRTVVQWSHVNIYRVIAIHYGIKDPRTRLLARPNYWPRIGHLLMVSFRPQPDPTPNRPHDVQQWLRIWSARAEGAEDRYAVLIDPGDTLNPDRKPRDVSITLGQLGVTGPAKIRDPSDGRGEGNADIVFRGTKRSDDTHALLADPAAAVLHGPCADGEPSRAGGRH